MSSLKPRRAVGTFVAANGIFTFVLTLTTIIVIGIFMIISSRAASPSIALEAEDGTKSGNAVAGDTTGASGGGSVQFSNGSQTTGTIQFEDDFNGPAGSVPDTTKWHDFNGCINPDGSGGGFGAIRCGPDEKLDGAGHLSIPATPTYGTAIQQTDSMGFVYGAASAWIKMPPQSGYWPAFWTTNPIPGAPHGGGEIDILEAYSAYPTRYHTLVHNWSRDGPILWSGPDDNNDTGVDLSAAFHKYTTKVEPNKISFFFDDKPIGTVITSAYGNGLEWMFGPNNPGKNIMILDLAVGGCGGCQSAPTANAQMLVDRVEVRNN